MAMQTRPVVFVVATVLLVPFVYALSYAPEVCAVPKDPNFGKTGNCHFISGGGSDDIMECCWEEPDILNPGKTITWCQRCADSGDGECGSIYLKATGKDLVVPPGEGVLQDPSTDSGPLLPEKGGFSLGPNLKSSQANVSSNNSSR